MKEIAIIGAGGLGREVQWLIERINTKEKEWEIIGYIDDNIEPGTIINGLKVIGSIEYLKNIEKTIYVVCAIGCSKIRKNIITKLTGNKNIIYPNLIDPSVLISDRVEMGKGCIVCAGSIVTVDIKMKDFDIINLNCTVGHDVVMADYVSVYPGVCISGNVDLDEMCELGTGMQIIQGKSIGKESIIGAGAVVIRDIPSKCTAVGNPAKVIKSHE